MDIYQAFPKILRFEKSIFFEIHDTICARPNSHSSNRDRLHLSSDTRLDPVTEERIALMYIADNVYIYTNGLFIALKRPFPVASAYLGIAPPYIHSVMHILATKEYVSRASALPPLLR